jgi:hypothetical protein
VDLPKLRDDNSGRLVLPLNEDLRNIFQGRRIARFADVVKQTNEHQNCMPAMSELTTDDQLFEFSHRARHRGEALAELDHFYSI